MTSAFDTIAERSAKNQATFRDANERIEEAAAKLLDGDEAPFICECPNLDCTELIRVPFAVYAAVREHGQRFLVSPGHEICTVGDIRIARVTERCDGYSIMDKVGEAAEVAQQLDPHLDEADV
jgi:hypothetical protein